MSRNYSQSNIDVVGDVVNGLHVETSTYNVATYWDGAGGPAQLELFNVYGRILLMHLYIEVTTVLGAGAAVVSFTYTSSSPVVAVAEICDACASIATLAEGQRIVWPGGIVATLAVITASVYRHRIYLIIIKSVPLLLSSNLAYMSSAKRSCVLT